MFSGTRSALALVFVLVTAAGASAGQFSFDFSTFHSLPGGHQGVTYYTGPQTASETPTMSIVGNNLHIDTKQYPSDLMAFYEQVGSYTHTLDAVMEARVYVSQTTNGFGFIFGFNDTVKSTYIVVNHTGWTVYGVTGGAFSDSSVFHTLKVKTFAATSKYELYVDGVLVSSGAQTAGYPGTSEVYFGDGTPTGGNFVADVASISYSNPAVSAPEPSTFAGALASIVAAGLIRLRKRSV